MSRSRIEEEIPQLKSCTYLVTSPMTTDYNCIAWAANCTTCRWWPDEYGFLYWPEDVAREETIPAFIAAFETLGYEKCNDGTLEPGYEKVALFADFFKNPTHMARQLDDGRWTSKLGDWEDIEHEKVEDVSGKPYGEVVCFMCRRKT